MSSKNPLVVIVIEFDVYVVYNCDYHVRFAYTRTRACRDDEIRRRRTVSCGGGGGGGTVNFC